jgi:hypothetical protein
VLAANARHRNGRPRSRGVGPAKGSAAGAVIDYRGLISTGTVCSFVTNYRYDAIGG